MAYRILVTGSRGWEFANTVKEALIFEIASNKEAHKEFVLIHGGCPSGADFQADLIWEAFKNANTPVKILPQEVYPGGNFLTFKERNQYMVDLGAHVVLSFATRWASGTGQTARMARRAGIRVRDFGVDTH